MKVANGALNGILGLVKVLVLMDGGREIKGEIRVDDVINHIGKGFLDVKKVKLFRSNGGTDVVCRSGNQGTSVNRVSQAISARDEG